MNGRLFVVARLDPVPPYAGTIAIPIEGVLMFLGSNRNAHPVSIGLAMSTGATDAGPDDAASFVAFERRIEVATAALSDGPTHEPAGGAEIVCGRADEAALAGSWGSRTVVVPLSAFALTDCGAFATVLPSHAGSACFVTQPTQTQRASTF